VGWGWVVGGMRRGAGCQAGGGWVGGHSQSGWVVSGWGVRREGAGRDRFVGSGWGGDDKGLSEEAGGRVDMASRGCPGLAKGGRVRNGRGRIESERLVADQESPPARACYHENIPFRCGDGVPAFTVIPYPQPPYHPGYHFRHHIPFFPSQIVQR
jgi:hypothetical protein